MKWQHLLEYIVTVITPKLLIKGQYLFPLLHQYINYCSLQLTILRSLQILMFSLSTFLTENFTYWTHLLGFSDKLVGGWYIVSLKHVISNFSSSVLLESRAETLGGDWAKPTPASQMYSQLSIADNSSALSFKWKYINSTEKMRVICSYWATSPAANHCEVWTKKQILEIRYKDQIPILVLFLFTYTYWI